MQANIPIVSENDFKTVKRLPSTLRYVEDMEPNILDAQEFDLLPVFPKEMKADIALTINNNGTVTTEDYNQAAYDALLPYMKDVVLWFAYGRYWQDAGIDITRSGPMIKRSTPNSEPVGQNIRQSQVKQAQNKGAAYMEKMIDYLNDNTASFSEWNETKTENKRSHSIGITSVGRLDYKDDRRQY